MLHETERNTEPQFPTDLVQNDSTLIKPIVALQDTIRREHQMLLLHHQPHAIKRQTSTPQKFLTSENFTIDVTFCI